MEMMSEQEKLELLKYLYDKARHEVDFLRKRQDRIFTWSSNVLLILIGALLIVDPTKSLIWSSEIGSKFIASLAVLVFMLFSVGWQQRTRRWHAENGQIVQKIERLLHCFDEGFFDKEGNSALFPSRWNQPDNELPPRLTKRLFAANFVTATLILGVLAIAMIWVR